MSRIDKLVVYDGECAFCNKSVQFIIKRDKKKQIYFTSNKSRLASKFSNYDLNSSILYIEKNKVYQKSTAALRIAKSFSGLWKLLLILWIIPRPVRDLGYDLIAKNRRKIVKDQCKLFTKEEMKRVVQ